VDTGEGLVSITPIRAFLDDKPAFYVYIKLGTAEAARQRRAIIGLFVLGSIFSVVITSIAIIFLFNSTILTRIKETLMVLNQVEVGNLAARVQGIIAADELGGLQQGVNSMVAQLAATVSTLEERVLERTKYLETSAELSRRMTRILDFDELLNYVVISLHETFGFYHTHIYLIDEESDDLVMVKGYGDVGEKLKAQGHRLKAGEGIVGTVASTNEPFMSNDVNEVLNFVRNPLLPDTNAELAVPLRKGERVLGVLDIQSEQTNRFTPTDVTTLQAISNQAAVAIDNVRLLRETQAVLQEIERLNRRLTREMWTEALENRHHPAFRFVPGLSDSATRPATDVWSSALQQAASRKELVTAAAHTAEPQTELAVPLLLRGELIGVMGIKRKEMLNWSEEELAAVESVANQTALALENARLSEEQEKTIIKLRDVDRLKSEFLTSMSHELRTPLNSIIGFADILLQGIDGPLTDQAITDINAIHNSGKHLLALINDILDLSKIEAGRMELAYNALSIDDVFNDVAASVSSLIARKPVDLKIDLMDGLPEILADPLRLRQILINLVSNAIKFTEEGFVTMQAVVNEERMLQISVKDTGIGIPEDKFNLVFEHFRQVDARTNRKYQGTGMGLAIARQLAELHGGRMWLESVLNEGTTFHFTIPLAAQAELVVS
jgi:signal transduction histidine kinase